MPSPLERLRHHVSGAIARGEAEAIREIPASSNLPDWPGAETVYQRVANINGARCKNSYADWVASRKNSKDWRAPEDIANHIIPAMNVGDEETLKAYIAQWPQFWAG